MKKKFLKITILLISVFLLPSIVNAASYTISVGSSSLSKGNTTKLTIKGSDVTGRFNISSSNSSVVSISEDRAWIENDTYSITLNALSVGTATITVTPSAVSDSSGNSANLSAKSIKITVSLPREKSSDNTLKSLSVEGFTISPEFQKDTLDYTVDVPEGTKSIKVVANANSRYAKVTGTGDIEVTEGINNLNIVVKAETGTERIYNLVVNVIDQNPIYVDVDGVSYTLIKLRSNFTCPDDFTETDIVIENTSIPACVNNNIGYTLVGLKKDDNTIESFIYKDSKYQKYNELKGTSLRLIIEKYDGVVDGLEKTELKIDGVLYEAYRFSNSSTQYVIYAMNILNGEKGLYLYDSVNKTFISYDTEIIDYLKEQNKTYLYVLIAFGGGLFLAIICLISQSRKKKKIKKEIEEDKNAKKEEPVKKDKKVIKEDKKIEKENINKEKIKEEKKEDLNEIKEINNDNSITETYYLFESDRKKKQKRN